MPPEPVYYESDSPCRKCAGVLRYRSPAEKKGQCVCCEQEAEERRFLRNYMVTSAPDKRR
jgi:hypothetical protein